MNKYKGVVGIDLGTTNSVVTIIKEDGKHELVKNKEGELLTPSFIWVRENEETGKVSYNVGHKARVKMETDPTNVLSSYKPHMGTNTVIKDLAGKPFTAQHCSFLALKYMKEGIIDSLGEAVIRGVITVPAYFNENQKSSTMLAAKMAGIDVLGIIPEPTSAALYYASSRKMPKEGEAVLVYDIGGGTFDVSIVHAMKDSATVLAVDGNHFLGGDDFDKALEFEIIRKAGLSGKLNETQSEILVRRAEKAKVNLTNRSHAGEENPVEEIEVTTLGSKKDRVTISLEEFEKLTQSFVDNTLTCVRRALDKVGMEPEDIDNVILVGGSSRLTGVRKSLIKFFDNKITMKDLENYLVDPDLSVSLGAAIYARLIIDKEHGKVNNILPMSLGIEDNLGNMVVLLNEGATLPSQNNKSFTNSRDNQEKIEIDIYEGSSNKAANNTKIGSLSIPVKPNTPKGKYNILVSFKMNIDGMLNVTVIGDTVHKLKIDRGGVDNIEGLDHEAEFDVNPTEAEQTDKEGKASVVNEVNTSEIRTKDNAQNKTEEEKSIDTEDNGEKDNRPLFSWEE